MPEISRVFGNVIAIYYRDHVLVWQQILERQPHAKIEPLE